MVDLYVDIGLFDNFGVALIANVNKLEPIATIVAYQVIKYNFRSKYYYISYNFGIFIAEDFKNGTIKNIASKGISEKI